jgi:hypothetical protein
MSALIASSKLSGCNDTDLAFGMALPPMAREKIQGQATFSYQQSQIQSGRRAKLRADAADVFYHFMRAGGTCIETCAEARESHLPNRCGRESDDEHCSKFRSSPALNGTSCAGEQMGNLVRSRQNARAAAPPELTFYSLTETACESNAVSEVGIVPGVGDVEPFLNGKSSSA